MYYFVAAWYTKEDNWWMPQKQWYYANAETEFDDTVNQIRMFQNESEPVELMVLGYGPQLRYFLHRQGIWPIATWSLFDEIQGVEGTNPASFFYRDLNWPKDIQWVYTPFTVLAYLHGQKYAEVEFGEEGKLLWISRYEGEILTERMFFDDRGFLSSILYYEGNQPKEQSFFNANGIEQFRINRTTKAVTVAETATYRFRKKAYESVDEVILEVLGRKCRFMQPKKDVIVLAAESKHNRLVMQVNQGCKLILSFFGERYDISNEAVLSKDIQGASFLVTDTESMAEQIRHLFEVDKRRIIDISPFDTRLSLGKSQQIQALKVFFPQDNMVEPIRSRGIMQMLELLQGDERIELIVATKHTDSGSMQDLRADFAAKIASLPGVKLHMEGEDEDLGENERVEDKNRRKTQISFYPYNKESEVIEVLRDVRLIVDIRDNPDQYIQIAGISAGIPQVNYLNTRYIEDRKNGYMIHNIAHLKDAMQYYLVGLAHWNEALVYCVQQVEKYASGTIVKQWKELVKDEL